MCCSKSRQPKVHDETSYYVSLTNYSFSSDKLLMRFQCNYKNTGTPCLVTTRAGSFCSLILLGVSVRVPSGLYYDKAVACNVNITVLNYVNS